MKIEELIKERNILKDALVGVGKLEPGKAEEVANEYININFLKLPSEKEKTSDYGIYYLKDKKGKEWIRIKTCGHDFCLSLFDMPGNYTLEECKKYAEDSGYTLPSKEEWDIIDAYRDEIDKIIEDYEGDKLTGCYWSVAQYSSDAAWFYYAFTGRLDRDGKYVAYHGRSLAYLSKLL